jgi:hypothetical protein
MTVISFSKNLVLDLTTEVVVQAAPLLAQVSPVRHAAIWAAEKYIQHSQNGADRNASRPPGVIADRAEFGQAILNTVDRILASGLSPNVLRRIIDNMVRGIAVEGGGQSARSCFFDKYGTHPPGFLTISPGKTCNLRCVGCYATSGPTAEKLDWAS